METSASRLWKRLSFPERLAAATHFWSEASPEAAPAALAAIVSARRVRPQVARAWPPEERARSLAGVLDVGEAVAAAVLVAFHLGERRDMLIAFLDAAGIPHEEGVIKEEEEAGAISPAAARAAVAALRARWPEAQVALYLNTLWLQDPERWGALEGAMRD